MEAKICPHCHSPLPALDPSFLTRRFIGAFVTDANATAPLLWPHQKAPRRFENWGQFWEVVN